MNKKLFDDWASTYHHFIQRSEEEKSYPFYGYGQIQKCVFEHANRVDKSDILEMGIGTGMMTKELYSLNHTITGVDFSKNMLKEAKKIMPDNAYIESEFLASLDLLEGQLFDTIIFSYSIHHLPVNEQVYLLNTLSKHLNKHGRIVIGDVMTKTKEGMYMLSKKYQTIWDEEEYYPTYEEYKESLLNEVYKVEYLEITECSGVCTLFKD